MRSNYDLKKCVLALQLADKFLKNFGTEVVKQERSECFMFLASALWKMKQTDRAIKAGLDGFRVNPQKDQVCIVKNYDKHMYKLSRV